MNNFWNNLKKPIMALAPMADVTDAAFRSVIAAHGKPDVMWTEFISADGLFLATPEGQAKIRKDLIFTDAERPIVAQFFTSRPEMMEKAARLALELGFDGVDINMGCPDKSIEKQKAGAALIKNPALARELIRAAKRGATARGGADERGTAGRSIPVSVKTRLGYNKDELETWLPELLAEHPAAITIHARTRKEMSKVPARWERIARAVEIRDELQSKTLILGNGDIADIADAKKKVAETGADGAMLGRAIFGNPWLFSAKSPENSAKGLAEKLHVMVEHTKLFEELLGGTKNFAIMKKHYKAYVNNFDGAVELRAKLMAAENAKQVAEIVRLLTQE